MGTQERERAVWLVERMFEATSFGSGEGFDVVAEIANDIRDRDEVALLCGVLLQASHASMARLASVMGTSPEKVLASIVAGLRAGI